MTIRPSAAVNPLRLFEAFLIALLLLTVATTVFLVGPAVEQRFFPVLDAKIVQMEEVGDRLKFYIEGTKQRGCQVVEASFAWRFDHTIMPAGISDENGQPRPALPIIQAGQAFVAGPFYALVPAAARLAPGLRMTRTYYYRCHFLWVTEYDLSVELELKPIAAIVPQSPTVRILPP